VSGERIFANARRSEVHGMIVPFGEILGFPSDVTLQHNLIFENSKNA